MPEPANIGPRGARRRAAQGWIALLGAAVVLTALVTGRAPLIWSAPYALLLWLGALGVLQARAKT